MSVPPLYLGHAFVLHVPRCNGVHSLKGSGLFRYCYFATFSSKVCTMPGPLSLCSFLCRLIHRTGVLYIREVFASPLSAPGGRGVIDPAFSWPHNASFCTPRRGEAGRGRDATLRLTQRSVRYRRP